MSALDDMHANLLAILGGGSAGSKQIGPLATSHRCRCVMHWHSRVSGLLLLAMRWCRSSQQRQCWTLAKKMKMGGVACLGRACGLNCIGTPCSQGV